MDFALSAEQQMLKETARRLFEKECKTTLVRELLESSHAHSPELWRHLVELGWLGLPLPEEYDGSEGTFLDLACIIEEMGRAMMPGPFLPTVLLGAYPVLDGGTAAQKQAILPKVASGELILTMAWLETGAAYDPTDLMTARSDAGGYILNGVKLFVPYAHIADTILTVVRTSPGDDRHGVSILLVNRETPGVACTLLKPIDDSKLCEVSFDNVRVPRDSVLGEVDGLRAIVDKALARAAVAECLQMVGAAQLALEMSVEHAKNRVQFGRAVGTFQAVQHHCADMFTDTEGARFLAYEAAWMIGEGLPCEKEVAMAKAWVSRAALRAVSHAHQVHGGVGFMSEHDLTLIFKRLNAAAAAYGGANYHYGAVAAALGM